MGDRTYHTVLAVKLPTFYVVVGDDRVMRQGKNTLYAGVGGVNEIKAFDSYLMEAELLDKEITPLECGEEFAAYGIKRMEPFPCLVLFAGGLNSEKAQPELATACSLGSMPVENYTALGVGRDTAINMFWHQYSEKLTLEQVMQLLDQVCNEIAKDHNAHDASKHRKYFVKHYEIDPEYARGEKPWSCVAYRKSPIHGERIEKTIRSKPYKCIIPYDTHRNLLAMRALRIKNGNVPSSNGNVPSFSDF